MPYRRAAQRERIEASARAAHDRAGASSSCATQPEMHLAERERRRVLQVRAADHHHVGEGVRLGREGVTQRRHGGQQRCGRAPPPSATCITAGNTSLDDWLRLTSSLGWTGLLLPSVPPRELDRAVGDHLVGVHVRLRARAGLEHDQRKLGIERAVDDFLRGTLDQRPSPGNTPSAALAARRRLLDEAEGAHHRPAEREAGHADREVLDRPLRLRAPQPVRGTATSPRESRSIRVSDMGWTPPSGGATAPLRMARDHQRPRRSG